MGVKSEEKTILKKQIGCEFTCDICGKFLGFSYAYDDGYVPVPSEAVEINEKFLISLYDSCSLKSKYEYLCKDCCKKYLKTIQKTLIENCNIVEDD